MRAVVLTLIVAAACRAAPPLATAADADRANVQLAVLQEGRSLLIKKCSNCHQTPVPADHAAREWPVMLDEMSQRSNLTANQRSVIEKYLVVMATR